MNADFAHLRAENKAANADDVANVEQFFEDSVVHFGLRLGADVVARHIHLNAPFRVLQLDERRFAHDAAAHYSACNAHGARLLVGFELRFDVG